tara:strand:+ start:36 stop:410 length:375 start_codon:yes stop_codon:yes gene_type:complete
MSNIPNRRERRAAMKHAGLLEQKRSLPFTEWCSLTQEIRKRGQDIHQQNLEEKEKKMTEYLEDKESNAMSFWKSDGYNEKEIKMLREAWAIYAVKDKETWKQDKKLARKLMKEATEFRNKRIVK